jgi:hypothetical protein
VAKRVSSSSDLLILACFALAKLALHLFFSGQYGYFRDEFYYLACGERLDWGYVDHPPFVALAAHVARTSLGESLFALRLFPAVAGALTLFLIGLIARELGGGRWAQALAALAALVAPVYLALPGFLSMNAFDLLFWALAFYLVVVILKHDRPRLWLLVGVVAGAGLMNKYSMGFWGAGLVAGLVLTPARRYLRDKWIWAGGAAALVIFLPHILWQIQHGFPTREFIRNATEMKIAATSPVEFLATQLLFVHPMGAVVALAGLAFLLFAAQAKPFRALGWCFLAVLAILLATRSKPYYLAPAFIPLLGAGGVALEAWLRGPKLAWVKPVFAILLVAGGAVTAPFVLPVLPVETYIRYAEFVGLKPQSGERSELGKLPQHYADMFGWPEMVETVAKVYHSLPEKERSECAIFGSNYGEAGAIDFFGPRHGLPKALSGHNKYWLWGPRGYSGQCVITVGERREDVAKVFEEVELAAVFTHPYVMPYENNLPIFICRRPRVSLAAYWPMTKKFI